MAQKVVIPIETKDNAIVLTADATRRLHMVYMGNMLLDPADYQHTAVNAAHPDDYSGIYNSAYSPSGSRNLLEPAITVQQFNGNASLDLFYRTHTVQTVAPGVQQTDVELRDSVYKIKVILHYKAYTTENVVEQWCTITNNEPRPVTLQKFASANLSLKANSYWLTSYHAEWAKEMRPEETRLTYGIKTLDSKLGTRANLLMPNNFILSLNHPANEDNGEVILGMLEWTGNFRTDFELDPLYGLRVISGINNYASMFSLGAGKEFTTPPMVFTYSATGMGFASRNLHTWAKKYKLLKGFESRQTLFNNWEATYFNFNEEKLHNLLKDTKSLGVDLFLLDDGWFGNKYPRNDDHAGLGDWQENRAKLPGGIAGLAKEATANGVRCGIWIEPEMVNPQSVLYNTHKDWVVRQPNRSEHYFRNQLVLDLANPKVQDFVFGIVDSLFIKAPQLAYIKWDCNSLIYNAYSPYLGASQSEFYIRYVEGFYTVLKRIRAKYPRVDMMLCSGGGGRVDYGALQYFTEYWPSDNTEPLDRIYIQWDYSTFFPVMASANHVTAWGRQSLKFKIDVAMMGKLGFDIVVNKLSEKDRNFATQAVAYYNTIKHIVWDGEQYKLASPYDNPYASILYVAGNGEKAIMFNYLTGNRYDDITRVPLKLKGLNPTSRYRISETNMAAGQQSVFNNSNVTYSGDYLMKQGINPLINGSRTSVVLEITKVR